MMAFFLRLTLRMVVSVFIFALVWLAGLVWFTQQIPQSATQNSVKTDAIVALTGGSGRIDYGLRLLAEGKARKLFVSGMETRMSPATLINRFGGERAPVILAQPDAVVILGFDADSTIGNAMETARWAQREGLRSLRLVTANYHMPRALREFHFMMPGALIIPDPVIPDDFSVDAWWKPRSKSSQLVLSEYHKYIAAILRHQLITISGDA